MRHRRACGLQDGEARRSLLNFHSLRRAFITLAINAGQPPHLVSLVVGHAEGRKGMTMGRYYAGPSDEMLSPGCRGCAYHPRSDGLGGTDSSDFVGQQTAWPASPPDSPWHGPRHEPPSELGEPPGGVQEDL